MSVKSIVLPSLHRAFMEAQARGHFKETGGSSKTVSEMQLGKLRAAWADAVQDIPYFGDLVRRGEAPGEITDWDRYQEIPVLSRQILQNDPALFRRRSSHPDGVMKTAGSTGTPLSLGINQSERDLMRIVKLAAWQHFGYSEQSRLFLIWGHSHLLGTGWRGKVTHMKRKLADHILGYQRADAYRLSPEICRAYAKRMIGFSPLGLVGYASALDLFVRHTEEYHGQFRKLGMRFILSTSEPPPKADSVPLLSRIFDCPVVQEYGGAEFGQVAFKCGDDPFEVYPDLNYLEAEDEGADGNRSLLVSSLYPRYMPLFRYRVGDAVSGAGIMDHGHVRRFDTMAGRLNDVIEMSDGQFVHSVAIFHCIHQEQSVHNIQMILEDDGIKINLICPKQDDREMESRIRLRMGQVHPSLQAVRFSYPEDLVTNRAGKRRWFVDHRSR